MSTHERRQRLSEQIADSLQREILGGGADVGRQLPTEARLMEEYGVSRTVVREAARILVQRGLVTVSPGRGMIVAGFDGSVVAEQFAIQMQVSKGTFEQLLQLRLAVEVQLAATAAQHATENHLERLLSCITDGRQLIDAGGPVDREAFLESDIRFHEVLAEAGGNPYFALVCQPINRFLRDHYHNRDGYPSDPRRTVEEHEALLLALRGADTLAAHQAMEHHLTRLLRRWSVPVTTTHHAQSSDPGTSPEH